MGAVRGTVSQLGGQEKLLKGEEPQLLLRNPADAAERPSLYGSRRGTKDTKSEMAGMSVLRAEADGLLVAEQPLSTSPGSGSLEAAGYMGPWT